MSNNKSTHIADQDVGLLIKEIVKAEVYRGKPDGYGEAPDEVLCVNDLIVTTGRNYIARRIAGGDSQTPTASSAMVAMAVGTGSTAPALTDGSTPGLYGEVKRKALSLNSAGVTASNVYTAVTTFGGNAESISSVQIQEAAVVNTTLSGQGIIMQRVTFSTVTLADSDLLKLTLETNVGSS